MPVLSGGGGGIFFFWQLGIIKYLEEHFDLTKVEARGASAGALIATLAVCNVDPRKALDLAHSLSVEAGLFDRKFKLAGVWGGLIRAWLYGLLPSNAADLVRGRLKLVVTDVRHRLKQVAITDFENNKDLVEANLASVHVPFFLDYRPFASYRGRPYVDGSLADFVRGDNSALLMAEGRAVVLDYFQDDQLQYKRMDFLKLPSHEQALALMDKGYAFAERVELTGRQQVVYSDDELPVDTETENHQDEEREKHRRRAERFQTSYVEPSSQTKEDQAGRQGNRAPKGIITGFDFFSQEEVERRQRRADRFSTHEQSLSYQPEPQDPDEALAEQQKQQRAKRFGTEYKPPDRAGLADADLLEERTIPHGEEQRRPEAIYVYGVDFMSSGDCMQYFSEYGPSSVEWLNDSACNVVFSDPQNAARAIVRLGRPLPAEASTPDEAGLDPADVRNLPYLWHKGQPFEKDGKQIALLFRMATLADTKSNLNSGRTRRLWNLPMQQAQRRAQQQKRRMQQQQQQQGAEDDVDMAENRGRGERGGARLARRKRRKQGLGEVDMEAAEDSEEGMEAQEEDAEEVQGDAPVTDLRELLSKRAEDGNLFSSIDAGIPPKENGQVEAAATAAA
ncbi:hypothetical protein WJX73_004309 [Symbiochloris irregularis]|uniref:Patatin n=1 Tax=Symbiochloris irregularis TaxID=706552 RepID=A0AAW1P7Y9_9CHLO